MLNFFAGLFIGGFFGVLIVALATVSRKEERVSAVKDLLITSSERFAAEHEIPFEDAEEYILGVVSSSRLKDLQDYAEGKVDDIRFLKASSN